MGSLTCFFVDVAGEREREKASVIGRREFWKVDDPDFLTHPFVLAVLYAAAATRKERKIELLRRSSELASSFSRTFYRVL